MLDTQSVDVMAVLYFLALFGIAPFRLVAGA